MLSHLTDSDLVAFLKTCSKALKPDGFIVVKENIYNSQDLLYDEEDSSATRFVFYTFRFSLYLKSDRSQAAFKQIFKDANLEIIYEVRQTNWPKQLFVVKMFALRALRE